MPPQNYMLTHRIFEALDTNMAARKRVVLCLPTRCCGQGHCHGRLQWQQDLAEHAET